MRGYGIIDGREASLICEEINSLIKEKNIKKRVVFNLKELSLNDSSFDIFIDSLSKLEIERIALVLEETISKFKFTLWKRRYKNFIQIEQFSKLEEAQKWLVKE